MEYRELGGFLNVYKEPGWTSQDVCAFLKRALNVKKVGHAGTLDPLACGVLLVAIGRATKDIPLTASWTKTYRTSLLLGITTDTQDISGTVTSRTPLGADIDEAKVRDAVMSFEGSYEQLTPMYSARKVGGKALYKYARKGEIIERKRKRVNISDISIESISLPHVTFSARVSGGTYIRTLCSDIGEKLGVGGCMESLTRLGVGDYKIENAMRVKDIASYKNVDALLSLLSPTAVSIGKFDGVHLGHRALLEELKKEAVKEGLKSVAIILKAPGDTILSDHERLRRTYAQGIDYVFELEFDERLKKTSAPDFLRMLCDRYNAQMIVAGEDISFGKNREGDAAYLREHAGEFGLKLFLIKKIRTEDEEDREISSTLVREKLLRGETALAERLLGGPIE